MKWLSIVVSFILSMAAPIFGILGQYAVIDYHNKNGPALGLGGIGLGIMILFWYAVLVVVMVIFVITAIKIKRNKQYIKVVSKAMRITKISFKVIGFLYIVTTIYLYVCLYFDSLPKNYQIYWFPHEMYSGIFGSIGASIYLFLVTYLLYKNKNSNSYTPL